MSKYKCVLPTAPFEVGQIVELTDAQAAGENATEIRFVAVEEVAEETPAEEVAEQSSADAEISSEGAPEAGAESTDPTVTSTTPETEIVVDKAEGEGETKTEEGA